MSRSDSSARQPQSTSEDSLDLIKLANQDSSSKKSPSPVKQVSAKTIDLYEKTEKIYRRGGIKGFFQNIRVYSGWFLMLLYFGQPWLSWDDRQLVWFDLPTRHFHVYGMTFFPQDFMLLSWLLAICAFGLFFITVFAGRVWCGYTCPQTAWTFAFMWIEETCEGSVNQRRKLDASPWNLNKLSRKGAKHGLWLGFAIVTALTFVGYFSPIRELSVDFLTFGISSWEAFWLLFFTLATYINAGWMREQVCIYMCPYARFQSAMFDKDTMIVSYDYNRGESRGSRRKNADYKAQGLGDCIDCGVCVQVCPTGIDIRDGLQYECISCAACIDACNSIMDKMGYQRGLVRYTTEHALEGGETHLFRLRLVGYAVALLFMICAFAYVVMTRNMLESNVIRDRNTLYQTTTEGLIENSYTLQIINKDQRPHSFNISVQDLPGAQYVGQQQVRLSAGEVRNLTLRILVAPDQLTSRITEFTLLIEGSGDTELSRAEETRFFAPFN